MSGAPAADFLAVEAQAHGGQFGAELAARGAERGAGGGGQLVELPQATLRRAEPIVLRANGCSACRTSSR